MIKADTIEQAANRIMSNAAIDIPEDYETGIRAMIDMEKGDLSAFVLEAMLENWQAAREDRRPGHLLCVPVRHLHRPWRQAPGR